MIIKIIIDTIIFIIRTMIIMIIRMIMIKLTCSSHGAACSLYQLRLVLSLLMSPSKHCHLKLNLTAIFYIAIVIGAHSWLSLLFFLTILFLSLVHNFYCYCYFVHLLLLLETFPGHLNSLPEVQKIILTVIITLTILIIIIIRNTIIITIIPWIIITKLNIIITIIIMIKAIILII